MKKAIYILLTFVILASTATAEKWELIDNKTTIPAPNDKSREFALDNSVVVGETIFSLNKNLHYSIIKSNDNCINWDSCLYSFTNEMGQSTRFYNLVSHNSNLFVLGDNGRVYKSFDKGITWNYSYMGDEENHPMLHLKFVDENIGFVGVLNNNLFSKTTDGGQTWSPLPKLPDFIPQPFSLLNFIAKDENTLIAILKVGTDFLFVRTFDGGNNWEEFETDLFEDTEFVNQDYDQMIYLAPYTFVESGYKDSKDGHTRIMRTIDFDKWEPVFISDTISGGKRLKSFQIFEDTMFGFGDRIFIFSKDNGNTWVDLYNDEDSFYENNGTGFAYLNSYAYTQNVTKVKDPDGNIFNVKKMFRYKLDVESSVESVISNLNIYPNPAGEEINISYDKLINSIEILDLNGKKVLSNQYLAPQMEQSLNIDYLQSGTYFIKINNNVYKRFVKE